MFVCLHWGIFTEGQMSKEEFVDFLCWTVNSISWQVYKSSKDHTKCKNIQFEINGHLLKKNYKKLFKMNLPDDKTLGLLLTGFKSSDKVAQLFDLIKLTKEEEQHY